MGIFGNLGNLIGNGSRYLRGGNYWGSYSNLEDYREWDNSLVYQKYRSVKDNLRFNYPVVRNFRLIFTLFLFVYLYGIMGVIGFMFKEPSLYMLLILTIGSLITMGNSLVNNAGNFDFRAQILGGDILGFKYRDKLWGETKSLSKGKCYRDQDKRKQFYRNMLHVGKNARMKYLVGMTLRIILIGISFPISPKLSGFGLTLFLSIHLTEYLYRIFFRSARRTIALGEYEELFEDNPITRVSQLEDYENSFLRDDGFRSYLSFGRYLLSFGRSEHGILTGWIYRMIYDWHFKPSRLKKLLRKNREYHGFHDALIGALNSLDRIDSSMISASGNNHDNNSQPKDSLHSEGYDAERVLNKLMYGDDGYNSTNIHENSEKMEFFVSALCNNGSLFGRAWLALFRRDERLRDEYLDSPLMDENQMTLIENFNEPLNVPYFPSNLPNGLSLSLLYFNTVTDLNAIRHQVLIWEDYSNGGDYSNSRDGNTRAIWSILDFNDRNEVDRLVSLMFWNEWDRIARERMMEDLKNLDESDAHRTYVKWKTLSYSKDKSGRNTHDSD